MNGHIRQRSPGSWELRYRDHGKIPMLTAGWPCAAAGSKIVFGGSGFPALRASPGRLLHLEAKP